MTKVTRLKTGVTYNKENQAMVLECIEYPYVFEYPNIHKPECFHRITKISPKSMVAGELRFKYVKDHCMWSVSPGMFLYRTNIDRYDYASQNISYDFATEEQYKAALSGKRKRRLSTKKYTSVFSKLYAQLKYRKDEDRRAFWKRYEDNIPEEKLRADIKQARRTIQANHPDTASNPCLETYNKALSKLNSARNILRERGV